MSTGLSESRIRSLKATSKQTRVADGDGLYLEITPAGRKVWRFRYRDKYGARKWRTIGEWPIVSLIDARAARDEYRRKLWETGDVPFEISERSTLLADVAADWLKVYSSKVVEKTASIARGRLETYILPRIGNADIRSIKPPDLLDVLRGIQDKGTIETAHRVKNMLSMIFRHAAALGLVDADPTSLLSRVLMSAEVVHHASITDERGVGALMRAISEYKSPIARYALRFSALTFCRPGEVRRAEWHEIDLDRREWKIPPEKMKMKQLSSYRYT